MENIDLELDEEDDAQANDILITRKEKAGWLGKLLKRRKGKMIVGATVLFLVISLLALVFGVL